MAQRILVANPGEPRTGQYAFEFYNQSHPVYGDPPVVARCRALLRGFKGKVIRVTVVGARIDADDGARHKWTVRSSITLDRYTDMFGPGSLYLQAIKRIREKFSDDVIVLYTITIDS